MSGQPTDLMKGKVVFELAELKGAAERLSDFLNRIERRRQQVGVFGAEGCSRGWLVAEPDQDHAEAMARR